MSKIKLETHMHTAEVSGCGKLPADDIVSRYANAGYAALIITDHLPAHWQGELSIEERCERFLQGYRLARKRGEELGLRVLLGAETRLACGNEDYLLYGVSEETLPELVADVDDSEDIRELYGRIHARGWLLVQAHPYRPSLTAADGRFLDGIEVYNGNPRHDSHNDLAYAYAQAHELIMTSGSDAHQVMDIARGGLLVPEEVDGIDAFIQYLRAHPQPERLETA